MICCEECFNDAEIRSIIARHVKILGNCEICGSLNVYIYDTTKNNELINSFNYLLDIYTPRDSLPDNFPEDLLTTLEYQLVSNWNIFKNAQAKAIELVKEICSDKYKERPDLFDGLIGIYEKNDKKYLNENSILKTYQWTDFVSEIKNDNRFHSNIMNVNVLGDFCDNVITLDRETFYYRARISEKEGYSTRCMGAPPVSKVKDGRANPAGIGCLYLSDSVRTTLHEVRSSAHDYVTIGRFQPQKNVKVLDFTIFNKTSPLLVDDIKKYAINKKHLEDISNEMSRPMRSTDGPLEYLPAQYIVEFIKSKGYEGVKYSSTVNNSGVNYAIFNEKLFNCIDTNVYVIEQINYSYNPIG